ncbi:unnamed protein product [Polarella glacialis]|uniref:Far11/STRP C-terminal domain-containing protein n=1 Tax=Polarella glacialis TaxID=89957 RepID=A0A813HR72_POLGL|nr:unnamed protein product [Polarella glacialis]
MPLPRVARGLDDREQWTATQASVASEEAFGARIGGGSQPLGDEEVLLMLDEFLYQGELRDLSRARLSFERIASSLGAEDLDALIPPCLEVLEFSNRFIRSDTLLCLMHISMGCVSPEAPGVSRVELGAAMRRNAVVLARHDAMQMLVRALEFLLGLDDAGQSPPEEGMFEREFRLILNCIYLQLLFNEHDRSFVQSLELGHGRLGASLVTLLIEAAMTCADSEKIPIKKVILLLLRVLQRLLQVQDKVLYPMPSDARGEPTGEAPARVEPTGEAPRFCSDERGPPRSQEQQRPRLLDFQAFSALHMHQRSMRDKYCICGYPAAVEEGLAIMHRYEDEFLSSYPFHPSEIDFMRNSELFHDAFNRYEELREKRLLQNQTSVDWPSGPSDSKFRSDSGRGDFRGSGLRPRPTALVPAYGEGMGASEGPSPPELTVGGSSSSSSTSRASSVSSLRSSLRSGSSAATTVLGVEHDDAREESEASGVGYEGTGVHAELRGQRRSAPPRGALAPGGCAPPGGAHRLISSQTEDHSPAATFQRLYMAIFPQLSDAVVLLLRLLLTSCSNVDSYTGVVDLSRERHAASLLAPDESPENGNTSESRGAEEAAPRQEKEKEKEEEKEKGGRSSLKEERDRDALLREARAAETLSDEPPRRDSAAAGPVEGDHNEESQGPGGPADSTRSGTAPAVVGSEAAEAQRHREIMAAAVAGVVLVLLKQARKSSTEQFASVAQLIADSNGALVVLKFLNQDLAAQESAPAQAVLPCLRKESAGGSAAAVASPSFRQACSTLRLVEVLYLLCKDCPERVRKYLIHYKAPFILKRLHRVESPQAQRLVLKLLKKQVRYLPRKWKQTNMKAISAMYSQVSMSPLEDWLLNDSLGEPSTEGPSQADVRASSEAYNTALMRHVAPTTAVPSPTIILGAEAGRSSLNAPAGFSEGQDVLGYLHCFPEYAAKLVGR